MDMNMIPRFLNTAVMPYEDDSRQKTRMMWLLPYSPWGSALEEECPRYGRRNVWSSVQDQRQLHPRLWNLGNGARLWEIPVTAAAGAMPLEGLGEGPGCGPAREGQRERGRGREVSRCHRELQTGNSLERIRPHTRSHASAAAESSQGVCPQYQGRHQHRYHAQCPLANTEREHKPSEREATMDTSHAGYEKREDYYADDFDVESERHDTHFAPRGFRFIPAFVVLSKRLNWDFFPKFVNYFFDNKRWPIFADSPREFQDYCANYGIGPDSYEYLPGFAPEWVFHLRIMDEQWFWNVIHYFFEKREFPCWNLIPRKFVTWFRVLKLSEFDYPDRKNKYEMLPKKLKERFGNFLEHRLRLTKRKFPKSKFPVRLDET